MIESKDTEQATFVNAGHRSFKGHNVEADVKFDSFTGSYEFRIGYRGLSVNPMASIAGDDRPEPCFQPVLTGYARVLSNGKVTGKTEPVPNYLRDKRGLHDIKIGLQLVNHNLPKYDRYFFTHANPATL